MTRIRCLLRELFDNSVFKIKIDEKVFQTPSGRKIELTVYSSNYHIEINPSDVGIYDRVVVQEVIKELAQTQQIDKSKHSFKVVVLMEADLLSRDAQHGLRRTMEKYSSNLRLIFCCNSSSKIIAPLRSRCFHIRVPSIKPEEMSSELFKVSSREGIKPSANQITSAAELADGNYRRCLLSFEAAISKNIDKVEKADWELVIDSICNQIRQEQTPASLLIIRSMLYDLLVHAIPASVILKGILSSLLVSHQVLVVELFNIAAFYEHRLLKGNKPILHLEAFVAKILALLSTNSR